MINTTSQLIIRFFLGGKVLQLVNPFGVQTANFHVCFCVLTIFFGKTRPSANKASQTSQVSQDDELERAIAASIEDALHSPMTGSPTYASDEEVMVQIAMEQSILVLHDIICDEPPQATH